MATVGVANSLGQIADIETRMTRSVLSLCAGLAFLVLATGSEAETFSLATAGLRGAMCANPKSQTFEQAEIFGTFNLAWRWNWGSGWHVQTRLDAAGGALHGHSDDAFIGSAGPDFVLGHERVPLNLEFGVSPTLLSHHEFGTMDFGTPLQFTTHVGLNWEFSEHFGVGYRYQHMSNAGFSNHNPGLNLHGLMVYWRF